MAILIKSKEDSELLFKTGFCKTVITKTSVRTDPDLIKISTFFMISTHTARRWLRDGLPPKIRHQLQMLGTGDLLPPSWRTANLKLCAEGVLLSDGRLVQIACIQFWPYIMHCVDWARVPDLIKTRL
jgi:hypothetical protein